MMKKVLALLLIICWMPGVKAQELNADIIPAQVKAAFNQRFGTATDWIWNMTEGNELSAIFKFNNRRHYAEINSVGEIKLLKYEVTEADLPMQISDAIKGQYLKHRIGEIDRIEKGEAIQYEVELDGYPDYIILFDPLGTVLQKQVD